MVSSAFNSNPFEILGVPENATTDEIKLAHRTLTKHWHPDRNKSKSAEETMKLLNWALEMALDPCKWKNSRSPEPEEDAAETSTDNKTQENFSRQNLIDIKDCAQMFFETFIERGEAFMAAFAETLTEDWEKAAWLQGRDRFKKHIKRQLQEKEIEDEFYERIMSHGIDAIGFHEKTANFDVFNRAAARYEKTPKYRNDNCSDPVETKKGWNFVWVFGFVFAAAIYIYIGR